MDPKNLTPGRRLRIMVTGVIRAHLAIVTDRKDTYGWCIVRVVGPDDSAMMGAELQHDDFVPLEYIFERTVFAQILEELENAPEGQVAPAVKARIVEFRKQTTTDAELYDFLSAIARDDVSSFVSVLCDVTRFYARPVDDVA